MVWERSQIRSSKRNCLFGFPERCIVWVVFQGDTEELASPFSIATLFLRGGELKQL